VRDEETTLSRCLKSVRDVADEVIVVDTGSTDSTVSVAADFGAKVYHFEWCDDFAAARNESIQHAKGDWILQIDADEELLSGSISLVRKALLNPWCLVYVITCDNGADSRAERFVKVGRLFRNHPSIRYSRPYHENVSASAYDLMAREPRWQVVEEPGIIIRHYGYEPSVMRSRQKHERGIRIMETYLREHHNDTYMLNKLGESYNASRRYDEAIAVLKTSIDINPHIAETHKNLGTSYFDKGMLDEAMIEFEKSIAINPYIADTHNNLGMVYYSEGFIDKAISEYTKALAIEPDFAEAHYNLALAYGAKGAAHKEISEYQKALAANPGLSEARANLSLAAKIVGARRKIGRNEPCPCGSGRKYKKCCGANESGIALQ
jgi:glycosyltransferase involved in cell wall biosynthesis